MQFKTPLLVLLYLSGLTPQYLMSVVYFNQHFWVLRPQYSNPTPTQPRTISTQDTAARLRKTLRVLAMLKTLKLHRFLARLGSAGSQQIVYNFSLNLLT